MGLPKRNHFFKEAEYVSIGLELTPIQPADFVVLVIRIIIAELCVQELIAGAEHWDAVREHEETEEVFRLFPAKCENLRGHVLISFVSAVPTVIRVHAILIGMAIFPVVFVVIRYEIVEREAIVAIDIVDRLKGMIGMLPAVRKQVVAAVDTTHEVRDHSCVAPDKTAK